MEWMGRLATRGTPPTPRKGHTMTRLLDSPLVIVFGGETESGQLLSDMYSLHVDRAEWTRITYADGPSPTPRILHAAAAISSTTIVIIGGDTCTKTGTPNQIAPTKDAWVFDIRTCTWRCIEGQEGIPPSRSCHSAIFGNGLGQVPAIYVFGGFGVGEACGSTVYRLRIGDWKWEPLKVVMEDADGREKVVGNLSRQDLQPHESNGTEAGLFDGVPSQRESHSAVWLPSMNGMLVIGGDGGVDMLNDVWLFTPAKKTPGAWRWRQLQLRMARGLAINKLPCVAGHSLIALPTEKTQVLLWGGIKGTSGETAMGAEYSYLLDLDAMQTTRIDTKGLIPKKGRLLHGLVRVNRRLITFGGCDSDGAVLSGVETGKLLRHHETVGLRAMDFGPVAAGVAAGGTPPPIESPGREEIEDPNELEDTRDDTGNVPQMGTSSIPKGTPLSGRIIDVTDYGYFVSVVINGKLYKGVLVANPLKHCETAAVLEAKPTSDVQPEAENPVEEAPKPKRIKLDPEAEALPDSPTGYRMAHDNGVIDLG